MTTANNTADKKWFVDAEAPCADIAAILIELAQRGALDDSMKQAIQRHAEITVSVVPRQIACMNRAIASAHAEFGLRSESAACANWGVAALAERMDGAVNLLESGLFEDQAHSDPGGRSAALAS